MDKVSAEREQIGQNDEARIIQFLQGNPEILMKYPEIFAELSIPHLTGGATSLIERQLKLLREDNKKLKGKIDELVTIARDNEELNKRFHRLMLELMNTDQLHDVMALVQDQVQTFFSTAFVCFRFLPGVRDANGVLVNLNLEDDEIVEHIKPWIAGRKTVCGKQDKKVIEALFGENAQIGSSALIPLYHTHDLGLLCLGSTNPDRFGLAMGTIFLGQLGELVSHRLQALLQSE